MRQLVKQLPIYKQPSVQQRMMQQSNSSKTYDDALATFTASDEGKAAAAAAETAIVENNPITKSIKRSKQFLHNVRILVRRKTV